jgi:ATP-dependent Lhr-like helicase
VIDHMVCDGYLYATGGKLAMGDQAARVYGRKHFMELYAVFSSPVRYTVLTPQKHEIGTLEQTFVDSLVETVSCFLLGGRPWVADHINHSDRTIRVTPAPRGKRPSWGGYMPLMLSFDVCEQIRTILTTDTAYPYISAALAEQLADRRGELGALLRGKTVAVQLGAGRAHLWTFAGGRINQTLRYVFSVVGGFKVVGDNFSLRLEGESVTQAAIDELLVRARNLAFWTDRAVWSQIGAALPAYRLSKLQRVLPPELSEEMVRRYLLDADGTRQWIEAGARAHVAVLGNEPDMQRTP